MMLDGLKSELSFPAKNIFIPKDLRMHDIVVASATTATDGKGKDNNNSFLEVTPTVVYNECGVLRLWAKLGCSEFRTQPKASMVFNVHLLDTVENNQTVKEMMCLKMFVLMLSD